MKRLNKKGFTLIELLAVIVVLAVIMVIATQQVNRTIKKARTNSFNETMQTVVKTAKLLIAENDLTQESLRNDLDYSDREYQVYVTGNGPWTVSLTATSNGKFKNIDYSLMGTNDKISSYCYGKNNHLNQISVVINDTGELSTPNNCSN